MPFGIRSPTTKFLPWVDVRLIRDLRCHEQVRPSEPGNGPGDASGPPPAPSSYGWLTGTFLLGSCFVIRSIFVIGFTRHDPFVDDQERSPGDPQLKAIPGCPLHNLIPTESNLFFSEFLFFLHFSF